jgi:hypothetical protein
MPSSVYGHNPQPEAKECANGHGQKSRVMQNMSDGYYEASG